MKDDMTSMERTLKALRHQEPDRVPIFHNLTMHGARLLDMTIQKYYSEPESMVKAQLAMRKLYSNDCVNAFTHASAEYESFGGRTIFYEDGPPNSGEPVIRSFSDIESMEVPEVQDNPSLMVTIKATKMLKENVGNDVPIVGVCISPFSMPVMQMGFENYFDLMYTEPEHFESLMKINEQFCIDLANIQLEAGATGIVYFDPISSTTIIPRTKYLETGFKVAKRTIKAIKGPTLTHFASGRILPIIDKIVETGTLGVGVGIEEDLGFLKKLTRNKLTLIGNLNGITMPHWTEQEVNHSVRSAIKNGAPGGGFLLSDSHGEVPFQVPESVITMISEKAMELGRYPIRL